MGAVSTYLPPQIAQSDAEAETPVALLVVRNVSKKIYPTRAGDQVRALDGGPCRCRTASS